MTPAPHLLPMSGYLRYPTPWHWMRHVLLAMLLLGSAGSLIQFGFGIDLSSYGPYSLADIWVRAAIMPIVISLFNAGIEDSGWRRLVESDGADKLVEAAPEAVGRLAATRVGKHKGIIFISPTELRFIPEKALLQSPKSLSMAPLDSILVKTVPHRSAIVRRLFRRSELLEISWSEGMETFWVPDAGEAASQLRRAIQGILISQS